MQGKDKKQYVTVEDIAVINAALNRGDDVRIQLTKDGYRIIADTVRVLHRGVCN